MGQPNQEPSMEDILASIKRIIAEDGEAATARVTQRAPRKGPVAVPDPVAPPAPAAFAPEPETPPEPAADVLELTSPLPDFAAAAPEPEPEPEPVLVAEPEPDPVFVPEPDRIAEPMDLPAASILSPAAESASRTAFAALSQLQVRAEQGRENTLDGLVADLLRPMLREWLDRELPAVVERLVSAEVARVSGR